jgi:hypothetical protein
MKTGAPLAPTWLNSIRRRTVENGRSTILPASDARKPIRPLVAAMIAARPAARCPNVRPTYLRAASRVATSRLPTPLKSAIGWRLWDLG